jgi:hypothetical protein
MQTDPFFLSSPYMPSSSTLSLLMTPVNMVDDFCSFQKDNGGEKVYRPILCVSTILNSSPASTRRKGRRREHMGSGMGEDLAHILLSLRRLTLYRTRRCSAPLKRT